MICSGKEPNEVDKYLQVEEGSVKACLDMMEKVDLSIHFEKLSNDYSNLPILAQLISIKDN